jgi:hypothetical protein
MENPRASDPASAGLRAAPYDGFQSDTNASGVSWAAVWAGGIVTAALSLILLSLGAGVGFGSVSVWPGSGASPSVVGAGAIVWLIFMQLVSASMGGYLAGRLRTKWARIHTDEVYFRDTAHGFLAWSVALVISASVLTAAATQFLGSTSPAETRSAESSRPSVANRYFVDWMFRSDGTKADAEIEPAKREAATILASALKNGELTTDDTNYLVRLVAAKTGADPSEASKKVTEAFLGAQKAAEAARRTLAHTLLWTFVALLIGAFCSSFAGTIGGRQRDNVIVV